VDYASMNYDAFKFNSTMTEINMMMMFLWVMMPCRLIGHNPKEHHCHLHHKENFKFQMEINIFNEGNLKKNA
jgi:hypothetical protein